MSLADEVFDSARTMRVVAILPDVNGPEQWRLVTYEHAGKTYIVAIHPEHAPITIDLSAKP